MELTNCIEDALFNCTDININFTDILNGPQHEQHAVVGFSEIFYAYLTPIIFAIGLCGNMLSFSVFMSKNLRNLSASRYLAALSLADICTLVFYVFGEWLRRGLKFISPDLQVTFLDTEGVCQIWLFLNYFSRFMSAWLIVCFTCERFVGVCMPLRRRSLGNLKETTRIIAALTIVTFVLVLYKPILSDVQTIRTRTSCTSKQSYVYESFILDSIYAILITCVPFLVITTLNLLIIRRLISRSRRQRQQLISDKGQIRLEFTLILLAISFFFVAFNLPFFVVWFRNFLQSHFHYPNESENIYQETSSVEYWIAILSITRTLFYMNYCINFFLYSITGAYFRKELKSLFFRTYIKYDQCKQPTNGSDYHLHTKQQNSCV